MLFADHLYKITLTINRRSFMTLGNADCSQILAKQTISKLNMLYWYNQTKLGVKIKGGWIKQRPIAK